MIRRFFAVIDVDDALVAEPVDYDRHDLASWADHSLNRDGATLTYDVTTYDSIADIESDLADGYLARIAPTMSAAATKGD